MMNILLVYPEFPDTFWSFKHALKFIRKKASTPPLGLLTVAAMLPKDWNKKLIDENVCSFTEADLAWADYVFLSAMEVQRNSVQCVIARCKEAGVKIVAGGPLFTLESDLFPEIDHLVLNEAELTLPQFLSDLEKGYAQHIYKTSEFPEIQQTPVPLWELLDLSRYDSMSLQFSRGCPFSCDFCNITSMLGHRPRTKNAAQILAELDGLYALGWRKNVFFVDDNFIGNKKQLKAEILPALIEWRKGKKGLPFQTEVSVNLADDEELLSLMAEAGFMSVFVGIETPSEAGLSECGKSQNKGRDLIASVKRLQRAGMQVQGGFIIGFDTDTASIFQDQIDFIQKSGIVTAMVGLLQAPFNTPLYERLFKQGRILSGMSGDNVNGSTNIIPQMGIEALREGYLRVLNQIYAPKPYYARIKTFLKEYKLPKIQAPLETQYILAFVRSIYVLGIKGVERVQYWRLIFWTLLRRPRSFPMAISLAITGYHFRKVCELHVQ
jgi:radical SAM superfamily enzyme YgiQ (UPF0313 family)